MKQLGMLAVAVLAGTFASTTQAVSGVGSFEEGVYVSVRGGASINMHSSADYEALDSTGNSVAKDKHDTTGIIALAFGRYLKDRPLRIELEASYQTEASTDESFGLTSPPASAGDFRRVQISPERYGIMGKLYLEHRGERGSLFAFGGVGGNFLEVQARETSIRAGGGTGAQKVRIDKDSDLELAYSGGAGMTLRISPKHQLELMYEYQHIGKFDLRGDGTPLPDTTAIEGDLSSHNLWIGYRFD